MRTFFRNAKRSGDLTNLTLSEVAEVRHDGNYHVVVVKKHKTSRRYTSPIDFYGGSWDVLQNYIMYVRPVGLGQEDMPQVFLTVEGKGITSSELNKAINVAWRAGCDELGKKYHPLTTSQIRKSATTPVRQSSTRDDEALATNHVS